MKIGAQLPEWVTVGLELRAFVVASEALGVDSLWCGDHVVIPERVPPDSYPYRHRFGPDTADLFPNKTFLESVATVAFVAGVSEQLEIGFAVLVAPLRHPLLLAKQLATIDVLSEGRLVAGLGVGWLREEMDALDVSFRHRGPIVDETLAILRLVWTGGPPVGFQGHHFRFDPVHVLPRPTRPGGVPIWIGGHSPAALRRCALHGSGWLALEISSADFAEHGRRLFDLAEQAGRPSDQIRRAVMSRLRLHDRAGEAESARQLADLRVAGCDDFILMNPPTRSLSEHLDRLGRLLSLNDRG